MIRVCSGKKFIFDRAMVYSIGGESRSLRAKRAAARSWLMAIKRPRGFTSEARMSERAETKAIEVQANYLQEIH
jgi:hypothetical protein